MAKILWLLVALVAGFSLFFSSPAHAYLDPGTGSYILQVLLAAIFAAGIVIKNYWAKVNEFFARIFRRDSRDENND
ncbi:MAG: hypothetical protein QXL34_06135 [Thermosphaera sp.]